MTQYLLSVYQPDGPIPEPEVLAEIGARLDALNRDMKEAGAWVFSAGLCPPSTATVLRPEGTGVLTTDGPFAEAKEVAGGFALVEVGSREEAIELSRRAAAIGGDGTTIIQQVFG